jgi:hypothetical protein
MTHRGRDCGVSGPSSPPLPLTHGTRRVQGNPPLPTFPPPPPSSYHPTIFSFPSGHNSRASPIAPFTVSRLFPKQFFPSLPLGSLSTSSNSSPKFPSPSLFGFSLPSLSLAAASAGAPLFYWRPPRPPALCTSAPPLPPFFNPIPKEKWSPSSLLLPGPDRCLASGVDRRVRGTAGGDRLESSCPPSTHVASLPCVNLLLNSVVSTDAFFSSVDLTDFYLGTDLLHPQFIKLHTNLFADSILSHLKLLPFLKHDPSGKPYLLFRIDKTMHGLKEAGKLSQLRLLSHFTSHGFHETFTPCLFRHVSRPISFVLVVDDFNFGKVTPPL